MAVESRPFSASSRKALRFAWAAAQERTGYDPPSAAVDSWDLLVGILLSHPGYSEAELTFRHVGLVAGQVLPTEYPPLSAEALNSRLAASPAGQDAVLSDEVETIVSTALEIAGSSRADDTTRRLP